MAQAQTTPVTGTFTATGNSSSYKTRGGFNISLSGFGSATVELQRSFDEGVTWVAVESFTGNTERRVDEPEKGIHYRFEATAYTSGTIAYRLGSTLG